MARRQLNHVMIFDAVRTPRGKGKEGGGLARIQPPELIRQLIDALARRNGVGVREVDHLMLGCVGQVGAQGGHIALVSKLHGGLPDSTTAWSINNYCVSGLSAVAGAVDKVAAGHADMVLAGGVESMSQVPFLADKGSYYTDPPFSAALKYLPVALSADILADRENVSRAELDAVAVESHRRAAAGQAERRGLQSLIPILRPDGAPALDRDEYVRGGTTAEGLAPFPAAFGALGESFAPTMKAALGIDRIEHRHAVVHAPGTADGAGLAVVGSRAAGESKGLKPRARVVDYAEAGGDAVLSLTAGVAAMDRVMARTGMALSDMAVIEYMEAFAVVPALFHRRHPELRDRVNVFGGHVAKGHALGATGAILVSSLVDAMEDRDAEFGLVVAFAASGIGSAMILQRES
jgi:acetyl-CoA C-acetyltransferase/acetyl-CoA acyltransferase